MKKIMFYLCFALAGVFVFFSVGWSFRCGNELASTGDSKIKILGSCGAPTSKEQKCLERHRETGRCINNGETWYYNCGDNDFIYILVFDEQGILISEKDAGRGFGLSDCRGKLFR